MHLQVLCEHMFACFVVTVTAEVEWMDERYVRYLSRAQALKLLPSFVCRRKWCTVLSRPSGLSFSWPLSTNNPRR